VGWGHIENRALGCERSTAGWGGVGGAGTQHLLMVRVGVRLELRGRACLLSSCCRCHPLTNSATHTVSPWPLPILSPQTPTHTLSHPLPSNLGAHSLPHSLTHAHTHTHNQMLTPSPSPPRSVVVGLSVERLTQDKVRWAPDDIANIQAIANRWGPSVHGTQPACMQASLGWPQKPGPVYCSAGLLISCCHRLQIHATHEGLLASERGVLVA
jgi:hypothetical protein